MASKRINAPTPKPKEEPFKFSFKYFDHDAELFNLGTDEHRPKSPPPEWFILLLDTLKKGERQTIREFCREHKYHVTDWSNTNLKKEYFDKLFEDQHEVGQFRITKGTRVIGVKANTVFYIVFLDVMHNHCDSDGYPSARQYVAAKSYADLLEEQCEMLQTENLQLKRDIDELLNK